MPVEDKVEENCPADAPNPETQLKGAADETESQSLEVEAEKTVRDVDVVASELAEAETIAAEELAELRQKAKERDEVFEKLQRTTADYLNFKKRKDKEFDSFRQFAVQDFVEALLPPLDNFSRAIESADGELATQTDEPEKTQSFESFLEGIRLIESQVNKVLSDFGVEPIEAVGMNFDPALHEVVVQEESEEYPNHTVLEEFQRGYLINGRLLRPSKVKVSVEANEKTSDDDTEAEAEKMAQDGLDAGDKSDRE